MKNILVTGCNRGIGLGLIKQLVKEENSPKVLIATCRDLEKAQKLRELADQNNNLKILELDVTNFEKFDDFSKKVEDLVGHDKGINVLINNAGMSTKFARIQLVKAQHLEEVFKVNTVGPIMLTKALLPLLKKATKNEENSPLGANKALVLNLSSILGSISQNSDGGQYPYRCSKVALNMATKSLSVDLRKDGVMVSCIHPGWVKTDLGGKQAPLEVTESVSGILNFIKNANEKHNGGFYQWDGKELPY